ncbi:hypothetical protein KUCAC02_017328 [Chaenocephalus aceratus]|uniref:Uncharacterized protein n=1 Tax=Chaenocephalus aceratus TaxID=36190 RepID=A0ACB9W1N4_CHAAC|nr:hypothetical protein KUCAC02_017328 [Chaenocephalus aceratus]
MTDCVLYHLISVVYVSLQGGRKSLVEQFIFEVLVILSKAWLLQHSDERSLGTVQQRPVLNQHNAKTRVPRLGFPPDGKLCLSDVLYGFWSNVADLRPSAATNAELFYEFIPLLSGKKVSPQWVDGMLKDHGKGFLIPRF